MATRLYFPSTTAAQVTPVANGSWGYTSEALNRKLVPTTKSNTALANGSQIGPWTAGQTALDRRYVSPPLSGAQTISGTVKCYLMAREFNNGDNSTSRMEIYVVHNDGQTVRGTNLTIGQYGSTGELINNATLRSKAFADGDTITSVSASDGDRIVVCIGYSDATGTTPEGQCKFGDPTSGTDLAENETNTTANPGWIEFSGTFTFQTSQTLEGTATLSGTGTVAVAGTRSTAGALGIVANATLVVSGTRAAAGVVSIVGTGILTAATTAVAVGSVSVVASGSMTANGAITHLLPGTVTFAVIGAMGALATCSRVGSAAITANATMLANGIRQQEGSFGSTFEAFMTAYATVSVPEPVFEPLPMLFTPNNRIRRSRGRILL